MILSQNVLDIQKKKNRYLFKNKGILSAWNFQLEIGDEKASYLIKNLERSDLEALLKFKDILSKKSRDLFCPYPWDDKKKLITALLFAIEKEEKKIDASFVIKKGEDIIGHFFLWKINNKNFQKNVLRVSEMGLAIADKYQNLGLGSIAIKILQTIAAYYKNDAVELTTDLKNKAGLQVYTNNGFKYIDVIRNPLEIDVTEIENPDVKVKKFRKEKQMIYIINKIKRKMALKYLLEKRGKMELYYQQLKLLEFNGYK